MGVSAFCHLGRTAEKVVVVSLDTPVNTSGAVLVFLFLLSSFSLFPPQGVQ